MWHLDEVTRHRLMADEKQTCPGEHSPRHAIVIGMRRKAALPHSFGVIEPTSLVPSGFSTSIHHMAPSGSGSGAVAWMS
ncbi:hypothetical protein Hhel01_01797 [Haloferula helveola]